MAHYALLDENDVVIQVITGVDEWETQVDSDGTVIGGSTEAWEEWYRTRPWLNAVNCKRTSYNTHGNQNPYGQPYRYNFASVGFTFDAIIGPDGAFIPVKPYPSWILNQDTCLWQAPIPYPNDGKTYIWDEATQSWVEVE